MCSLPYGLGASAPLTVSKTGRVRSAIAAGSEWKAPRLISRRRVIVSTAAYQPGDGKKLNHDRLISNSLASSSCSEASYSEWVAAAHPPTVTAQQSHQAKAHQADDVLPATEFESKGRRWRIRPYCDDDLLAVTDLQANSFYEGLPIGALDALAYTMFRAEVLDGVKKKANSLTHQSFAMMVVEQVVAPHSSSATYHGRSSSLDSGSSLDADEADTLNNVGGLAGALAAATSSRSRAGGAGEAAEGSSMYQWLPGSSSTAVDEDENDADGQPSTARDSRVVGVIEVSIQEDQEVLRHLRLDVHTYAYVSSMAVSPQLRRKGVATAMLAAAEQQARLWQQPVLALHVYVENQAALQLYTSCGLESVGTDPSWKAVFGGKIRTLMVKQVLLPAANA